MQASSDAAERIVRVRWHDAWFDFEHAREGFRADYIVETVGFLVRESRTVISVAAERLPGHDGFRAVTHIERKTVQEVVYL